MAARSCLKSLFGVSRNSKNHLHRTYRIPDVSKLVEKQKLSLLKQLLANPSTTDYATYTILINNHPESSAIYDAAVTASRNSVSLVEIVLCRRVSIDLETECAFDEHGDDITRIRELIDNWSIYENRLALKNILEQAIPRS